MNKYKIYENQGGLKEAVKQGWSWPAAFFSFIWAFIKKMNALGAGTLGGFVMLGVIVGVSVADEDTSSGLLILLDIASFVVFGVNGNAWRENNLMARGYMLTREVSAASDEAALGQYTNGPQQFQPIPPPPPPPARPMKTNPVYRVGRNGVDLGEMTLTAINTAISEGRLTYEDHYFDVMTHAWRRFSDWRI